MRYIALLRGINVGGKRKVSMPRLRALLTSLGYINVSTYLNSGNAFFKSHDKRLIVQETVESAIESEFGFHVPTLIISAKTAKEIASAIPSDWENDKLQKSDVAYLFPDADTAEVIPKLPLDLDYIDVRYVKGALFWHVTRDNQNNSKLSKIVGHKLYKLMTVRNVNTARYIALSEGEQVKNKAGE